jgi:hypothetical protein
MVLVTTTVALLFLLVGEEKQAELVSTQAKRWIMRVKMTGVKTTLSK